MPDTTPHATAAEVLKIIDEGYHVDHRQIVKDASLIRGFVLHELIQLEVAVDHVILWHHYSTDGNFTPRLAQEAKKSKRKQWKGKLEDLEAVLNTYSDQQLPFDKGDLLNRIQRVTDVRHAIAHRKVKEYPADRIVVDRLTGTDEVTLTPDSVRAFHQDVTACRLILQKFWFNKYGK